MRVTRLDRMLLCTLVLALLALPLLAARGDDADRVSKNGKTEGTIDGVEVTLEYGRPNVREREIWGDLLGRLVRVRSEFTNERSFTHHPVG